MTAAEDAAASRKARRRFSTESPLPSPLDTLAEKVPEEFWPTRRQLVAWSGYLHTGMAPDTHHWWYGWCPIHDKAHDEADETPQPPNAMFNWKFGVVRCLADNGCHPGKRNATLHSVIERRAGVMADVNAGR